MTWVLDLDGVVWRGNEPIAGSIDAIERLQRNGVRVGFVTNNSALGAADQVAKLAALGVASTIDDIVSAHDLLIKHIGIGKRIMCLAREGLTQSIRVAGNTVYTPNDYVTIAGDPSTVQQPPEVDVVVAGQRFDVDYLQLSVVARALLQCRLLYAANRDPLYPHETGMLLGTGSIVAALETAGGVKAEVVGKPEQSMVDATRQRFPDAKLIVGDQLSMDGELARKAGLPFAFVASGVDAERSTKNGDTPVAHTFSNLAALVEALL